MIGEYIPSGQGTVDTIRLQDGRTIQVSAVDGRSNPLGEYIPSGHGTVDTIRLQDGGTVQVSAVDGRSNPHCHCAHTRSNGKNVPQDAATPEIRKLILEGENLHTRYHD